MRWNGMAVNACFAIEVETAEEEEQTKQNKPHSVVRFFASQNS